MPHTIHQVNSNIDEITQKQIQYNIEDTTISDTDLIEIAGYHAYNRSDIDKYFEIDDERYRLIDITPSVEEGGFITSSGLDAITLKKVGSDDLVIGYVGSEQLIEDWFNYQSTISARSNPTTS